MNSKVEEIEAIIKEKEAERKKEEKCEKRIKQIEEYRVLQNRLLFAKTMGIGSGTFALIFLVLELILAPSVSGPALLSYTVIPSMTVALLTFVSFVCSRNFFHLKKERQSNYKEFMNYSQETLYSLYEKEEKEKKLSHDKQIGLAFYATKLKEGLHPVWIEKEKPDNQEKKQIYEKAWDEYITPLDISKVHLTQEGKENPKPYQLQKKR